MHHHMGNDSGTRGIEGQQPQVCQGLKGTDGDKDVWVAHAAGAIECFEVLRGEETKGETATHAGALMVDEFEATISLAAPAGTEVRVAVVCGLCLVVVCMCMCVMCMKVPFAVGKQQLDLPFWLLDPPCWRRLIFSD